MRLPITPGSYEPGSLGQAVPKKGLSKQPRLEASKCDSCLACWIFCPDIAITIAGSSVDVDLRYCKGCGICATECRRGAISMVEVG